MHLHLDPGSPSPIYEQIRAALADAVIGGEIPAGEALPSIRGLARDLRVSVITTTRAYNELVADGLAVSVPGKGVFVRAQDPDATRARTLKRIRASFGEAARAAALGAVPRTEMHRLLDAALEEEDRR